MYPLALSCVVVIRCHRRRTHRQHDPEDRAAVRTVFYGDATAICFDGPFSNGQSKSRAALIPRAGFVEAKESVENALPVFRGDSWPFVGDREMRLITVRRHANTDRRRS